MSNDEKYTICHVLYEEFPRDPRVRRYINALNEIGIKCVIICSKKKNDKYFENWKGNRIYRIPISKKRSSFLFTFFEYLFFTGISLHLLIYLSLIYRFKIIHVHTLPDFLVFATLFNRIFGTKIILDLHELFPELYMARTGAGETSFGVMILRFFEKISIKFASQCITIHDNAKNIFCNRNKGIDNKMTVIMNGVDPEEFKETKLISTGEFIIIYNGTINKILNLGIIIEAMYLLRKKIDIMDFEKIKFKLYGDGPSVKEILRSAKNFDLENNVEYMGFMQPELMYKEILKSSVLIIPPLKNIYSDLFYTIKLVEMIYLHIPTITTRLNTYMYYYSEDSLFYFDSGNAEQLAEKIIEVYFNKDLVKQKTENAYKDYMKVSWEIMKARYLNIINNLIES